MRLRECFPSAARRRRKAFTLVEVLVALSISAALLLSAHLLLESLGAGAARIAAVARAGDADANGERLLRSLVGQIEVGTKQAGTFGGDAHSARFTTWCTSSSGWPTRCRVELAVEKRETGSTLLARLPDLESIVLAQCGDPIELRYLADARSGGTWFVSWGEGLATPGAIGVIVGSDTLIVRIGERG